MPSCQDGALSKWVVEADRGRREASCGSVACVLFPWQLMGGSKTCALKHVPAMHGGRAEMSMLLPAALTPPASVSAVPPRYVHGRTAGEVFPGHG